MTRHGMSPFGFAGTKQPLYPFPLNLSKRASFLAKLHREKGAREWLTSIIRERVELEDVAFAEVKRELKEKQNLPDKKMQRKANP